MDDLKVFVGLEMDIKTCEVTKVMTAMGKALLEFSALRVPEGHCILIVERDTGKVVFGTRQVKGKLEVLDKPLCNVEDLGIPLSDIQAIKDDRFDKEVLK